MIHIIYRATSNVSGGGHDRPENFSYTRCLDNILSTIRDREDVKFHFLCDGTYNGPRDYMDSVIEFEGGSDVASFLFAWNFAKELNLEEDDLLYFLENDYLHVDGWVDKVFDIFKSYNINGYVSLYDCPDKYSSSDYPDLVSCVYITQTSHWRTTPSTTGTFIINKRIFDEDSDVHTTYYSDHHKFVWLTENRGRLVITPIPTLSTHCVARYMAPIVNWNTI